MKKFRIYVDLQIIFLSDIKLHSYIIIHCSKVHSKIDFVEFPAACDVCEKVLANETNLKQHKKNEHTYQIVKFQCNECEFMANEPHTLHVHFGVNHSEKKHCGLCDQEFVNSQQLKDHLS